jgi:hypothetical protein
MQDYEQVATTLRAPLPDAPTLRDFVRYATLAPNGHNTQPWRFRLGRRTVSILPDLARATPAVDPDDHHLFISLGCAAEHFCLAARANGRPAAVEFSATAGGRIDIDVAPSGGGDRAAASGEDAMLYQAIPHRQSTRSTYDGSKVSPETLRRLEHAAAVDGVHLTFLTTPERIESLVEFVTAANAQQLASPAFRRELRQWIRFNPREALRTRDGLHGACTGAPAVPGWFGRGLFRAIVTEHAENRRYAEQLRSSAGVAVFTAEHADPEHWIRVGRSFDRFALAATALGIRHAHVNQPVEVASLRHDFAAWLGGPAARPDLVVRFGYGAPMPMSLRRPVEEVVDVEGTESAL